MNILKSIVALSSLFVLLTQLSAQQSRPGFMVTHERDTIRGEIQNRYSYNDFISCLFVKDGNSTEFFPKDIMAFGYDEGKLMRRVSDKHFGEVLVKGTINLIATEDQFFVEKEDEIYLLERKFIKTVINGQEGVKEDRTWQGVLSILIGDCITNSNEAVSKTALLRKSLTKLILRYNRCQGDEVPEEKVYEYTGIEIGVLAGMGRLNFDPSFGGSDYDPTTVQIYQALEQGSGTSTYFGVFLDLMVPKISDQISFHTELIFTKSTPSTEGDLPTGLISTDAEIIALQIPIGARMIFPQKGFLPFLDLGVQVDLDRETTTSHQIRPRDFGRARVINNSFEINGNALGMYFGAGVAIPTGRSRASVQIRYTRKAQDTNDMGDLTLGANQWHFLGTFSGLLHRKSKG